MSKLTPAIANRIDPDICECVFNLPKGYKYNPADFLFGDATVSETQSNYHKGNVVVFNSGKWYVKKGGVVKFSDGGIDKVNIGCLDMIMADKIAFPIDPRLTAKDINGATIIKPNASNTAWTFAHATKAEHTDRIWLASTAMSSVFDRVMEDRLQQSLASIINNPQTNQQRGVYLKWADMLDFKKDCTAYCVRFEKLLYLGQHKHQSGLNLRDMLLLCIKHVKQEWQKTDGKFDDVAGDVNGIIAALEADHNWETRWEQEKRQKAEAAAREAETASNENQ